MLELRDAPMRLGLVPAPAAPTIEPDRQPGPGTVLEGTYRLVERLAEGGMGEVYLATHERTAGSFAVKVLHADLARNPDAFARFSREALAMSGLQHPNVAQVLDFNVTDQGVPYLVMELLDGEDLQTLLNRGERFDPARIAIIVRQIASALHAAHAHGIVHRDLKPENVMLVPLEGHDVFVKVFDFGISKVAWSSRHTHERTVMGTPEYMSPEQAQGRLDQIDHRTDQFALAAMTYTLLAGRRPFTGDDAIAVLYQVVHADPPPLAGDFDWRWAGVEAVIRQGLAKAPEDRFPDVVAFARALEEAVAAPRAVDGREASAAAPPGLPDDDTFAALLEAEEAKGIAAPARSSGRAGLAALLLVTVIGATLTGAFQGGFLSPKPLVRVASEIVETVHAYASAILIP